MGHTGIAVLESRWAENWNLSVRSLFDLVADICCDNPHAYHYEMAGSEAAAKEAIPRIAAYRNCKYLYIAAHGNKDGIHLHNGEKLTRSELRNILRKIKLKRGSTLEGIHLASCFFCTDQIASYIFEQDVSCKWIAGYNKEIDWVDSSALDLLFFNELVQNRDDSETANKAIERTAGRISKIAYGLAEELGFGIYVRKQRTGGAKNLLSKASA